MQEPRTEGTELNMRLAGFAPIRVSVVEDRGALVFVQVIKDPNEPPIVTTGERIACVPECFPAGDALDAKIAAGDIIAAAPPEGGEAA